MYIFCICFYIKIYVDSISAPLIQLSVFISPAAVDQRPTRVKFFVWQNKPANKMIQQLNK